MNLLVVISTLLAISLYFPLCYQLLTGKVVQNLATWLLWSALDAIAAVTIFLQDGNYLLAAAYTVGGSITALCILKSRNFNWTRFESFVTFLVIVCLVIWYHSGPRNATIASTLAMVIAGIPQTVASYRKPWETPILIFVGYFFANLLSTLGGKDWSIEEVFYPASATIYCGILVVITYWRLCFGPLPPFTFKTPD